MKKNIPVLSLIFAVFLPLGAQESDDGAVIRPMQEVGVGVRALSLSGNFVALSNDMSALYWNPAALSFLPVREFQIGLDGYDFSSVSEFFGDKTTEDIRRFRLNTLGFMISVPASRGGLTIAAAYYSPVLFDDISDYSGSYTLDGDNISIENRFKTSGGLRFWSGGFGLQVAPSLSAGATISLITGKENANYSFYSTANRISFDSYEWALEGRYVGFDLRGGLLYQTDKFSAGMRFSIPQVIAFTERFSDLDTIYKGKMYSSYSAAAGLGLTLPFITITAEGRVKFPFDFVFPSQDFPSGSQAGHYKVGGGVGIEVPVVVLPLLVRTGFSIDEVDLHSYAVKYGKDKINWSDCGVSVGKNKSQFTAGIGYSGSSFSFDVSYGYSKWQLITRKHLKQDYTFQRAGVSLAIRY